MDGIAAPVIVDDSGIGEDGVRIAVAHSLHEFSGGGLSVAKASRIAGKMLESLMQR